MTMIHERPTAQIIAFPKSPRFGAQTARALDRAALATQATGAWEGGLGESWYHAAAIREAERATKS